VPAIDATDASAVSWAAIFAGALGAVAASVILIELGLGLGFASTSAWTNSGASLATLGVMGGVWLILAQWISAGIGGYLAGRLRTKWTAVHTDEVFFRDTAHGFLAWALGTVIGVLLIAAAGSAALNASGAAAGAGQGAAIAGATSSGSGPASVIDDGYYVDMLYRPAGGSTAGNAAGNAATASSNATAGATTATPNTMTVAPNAVRGAGDDRAVARRILIRDLPNGSLTPDDRTYLAQSIAARNGISQAEAEQRVDQTVAQIKSAEDQARQAAEKARKAAAFGSIATALAMVVGAFIAAVSAALGGKLRDEY
jgi:hypothetical protein